MKNFLNKKTAIIGICLVVAIIVIVKNFSKSTDSHVDGIGKVVRQDLIQRVTMAGTVYPIKKTVIVAPYDGYVKKLFVKVGDRVKAGDPLVSVVQSLQNSDNAFPIRSPLNGLVVQLAKSEGEYVKNYDLKDFIMRIDDNSKFQILSNVPEIDRVKLKAGQETIIKASAILTKTYKGIIRELALAANQKEDYSRSQNVEFPIKIDMVDNDENIKSGMSVVMDVITNKKLNILTLNHEYIRQENEKYFVILADGQKRDIKIGIQNEVMCEVVSGLNEGEKVKLVDFSNLTEAE